MFIFNNVGIVTSKDAVLINQKTDKLIENVRRNYYKIDAKKTLIKKISYRPFDNKLIYYDVKLIERARVNLVQQFTIGENVALVIARQCVGRLACIYLSQNKWAHLI